VICITKIWLSELVFDKEILPSHYAIYCKDRGSRGGGVLVAVDESIPSSLIDSPPNLEIIVVQLGLTYPTILCTVYIPPNSSDSFDILIPFLADILSSNTPCFIVGDFNLPDICWSTLSGGSSLSSNFCDFVFDCNLTQHILEPTHIKGNTLDLVFTNNDISISNLAITPPGKVIDTDHFLITSSPDYGIQSPIKVTSRFVFDHSKADLDGLCSYLLDTNFDKCFQSNDVESVWNELELVIYDAMHLFIPKIKINPSRNPKWFTPSIRHRLNCLRTLRRKFIKHPTEQGSVH